MSYGIDVNLLLYASDTSSRHYADAAAFLARQATATEIMYVAGFTLASYLRIATHPAVFQKPLTPEAALRNVRNLMDLPSVRLISEEEGILDTYESLVSTMPVRGNLVPDAWLAALLVQHGIRVIYTNDADFRKFKELTVRNPFTAAPS